MDTLRQNKMIRILIIVFMVPLTGSAIDIYVPSLPAITHFFNVSSGAVQLTIPFYLLGYSIAMLFCGVVSDSIGRKPMLIMGISVYCLVSYLATLSPNITTLIIIRFIQGIAVAGPGVLSRAIASDSFTRKELPVITNYITIAWATGPILAPVIGGYLQSYFNWHAPFYFLAIFAALNLVLVIFLLPETLKKRQPLRYHVLFENYKTVITCKFFIVISLMAGIFYTNLILFNLTGPFLIQTVMHYSPVTYGHMALILGIAWFLGSVTNRFLINRLSFNRLVTSALSIILLTSIVMVGLALWVQLSLSILLIPIVFILFASSIAFTNCFGKCLTIFPQLAGTASAIMGSIMVGSTAITTIVASQFKPYSMHPLALVYMVLSVIVIVMFRISKRNTKRAD